MRITHPRPELGRQTFLDVEFIDGTAEVLALHPERHLAFEQHGFVIDNTEPELGKMTKGALVALAEANHVDLPSRASAREIRGILGERIAPAPDPGRSAPREES